MRLPSNGAFGQDFFHFKALEQVPVQFDIFLRDDGKAQGRKRWLCHQAGMGVQPWGARLPRFVFYSLIKLAKKPGALRGWSDIGEVDITRFRQA